MVVLDPMLCRLIMGVFQYILITRSELSYAVNKVYQFMHKPRDNHCKAIKCILRYLVGIVKHGFLIRENSNSSITRFCDVD